ncbi:MAG: hypothetical protein ABSC95_00590 [Acetobacteraceae bacterium]
MQLMVPMPDVEIASPARTSMEPNCILLNVFVQFMVAAAGLAMRYNAGAASSEISSFRRSLPLLRA